MPRNPFNIYSTGSEDDAVSASLGLAGSDYIDDTDIHIAGEAPDGGGASNEVYHPKVGFWVVLKDVDGSTKFGANCKAVLGDNPQDGEPVGNYWVEGALQKIQLQSGIIRAVRGD